MVTEVDVVCSHIETSSKRYLCSYVKWSLKLSDLNEN
jgi:hypothetical protein